MWWGAQYLSAYRVPGYGALTIGTMVMATKTKARTRTRTSGKGGADTYGSYDREYVSTMTEALTVGGIEASADTFKVFVDACESAGVEASVGAALFVWCADKHAQDLAEYPNGHLREAKGDKPAKRTANGARLRDAKPIFEHFGLESYWTKQSAENTVDTLCKAWRSAGLIDYIPRMGGIVKVGNTDTDRADTVDASAFVQGLGKTGAVRSKAKRGKVGKVKRSA